MPTYEYACSSCHRRFEVVQRFSDAPLETCEVCGGALKRVFHPVGIVLKGSGFYSTDNRGGKSLSSAPKEGSAEKKTETTSETKSSSTSSDSGGSSGSGGSGGSGSGGSSGSGASGGSST